MNDAPSSPRTALRTLFEIVTFVAVVTPPSIPEIPCSFPETTTLIRLTSAPWLRIVPFGATFSTKTELAISTVESFQA